MHLRTRSLRLRCPHFCRIAGSSSAFFMRSGVSGLLRPLLSVTILSSCSVKFLSTHSTVERGTLNDSAISGIVHIVSPDASLPYLAIMMASFSGTDSLQYLRFDLESYLLCSLFYLLIIFCFCLSTNFLLRAARVRRRLSFC